MKLYEMMLEVAKTCASVEEGVTSSSGTTTTAVDSTLQPRPNTYEGGTIFILEGTDKGHVAKITSCISGTITFSPAATISIPNHVRYAVCPRLPSKSLLQYSINTVLRNYDLLVSSCSTVVVESQTEYLLPSSIRDVYRVLVASSATSPYGYERQKGNWWEMGGYLRFNEALDYTAGNNIEMWYYSKHPVLYNFTDDIDAEANLEFVKWAAVVEVRRSQGIATGKDQPMLNEFLQEAVQMRDNIAGDIRRINKDQRLAL